MCTQLSPPPSGGRSWPHYPYHLRHEAGHMHTALTTFVKRQEPHCPYHLRQEAGHGHTDLATSVREKVITTKSSPSPPEGCSHAVLATFVRKQVMTTSLHHVRREVGHGQSLCHIFLCGFILRINMLSHKISF